MTDDNPAGKKKQYFRTAVNRFDDSEQKWKREMWDKGEASNSYTW